MPALRSIAKASKIDSIRDRLHPYKSAPKSISKPQPPQPPPSPSPIQTHNSTSPCTPPPPQHRPRSLAACIDLWNQEKIWNEHDLERVDGQYAYNEREHEESEMGQANDLFFQSDLSWRPEARDDAEPGFGESYDEDDVRGRQRENGQGNEVVDNASEASAKILIDPVTIRAGVEAGGKVKFDITMQQAQDWCEDEEDGEWEDINDADDTGDIAVAAAGHSANTSKSSLDKVKAKVKETNAIIRSISLAAIWQRVTTVAAAAKDSLIQAASHPHPPSRYELLLHHDLTQAQSPLTPDERARACSGLCIATTGVVIVVACLFPASLFKALVTLSMVVFAVFMMCVGMLG